jgi:hypothetical protein
MAQRSARRMKLVKALYQGTTFSQSRISDLGFTGCGKSLRESRRDRLKVAQDAVLGKYQ